MMDDRPNRARENDYRRSLPPKWAVSNPMALELVLSRGADGDIWFGSVGATGKITTAGVITGFPSITAIDFAVGSDGNMWFLKPGSPATIGETTADGRVISYPLPPTDGMSYLLPGLRRQPVGQLGTMDHPSRIVSVSPSGAMTILPDPAPDPDIYGLITGPDGNLWFVDGAGIDRMTPSGRSRNTPCRRPRREQAEPLDSAALRNVTSGPDGRLWVLSENDGESVSIVPIDQPLTSDFHFSNLADGLTLHPGGLTFSDADLDSSPASYAATLDWGNGTTSAGTVVADGPGSYHVEALHTYATAETSSVTLQITDIDDEPRPRRKCAGRGFTFTAVEPVVQSKGDPVSVPTLRPAGPLRRSRSQKSSRTAQVARFEERRVASDNTREDRRWPPAGRAILICRRGLDRPSYARRRLASEARAEPGDPAASEGDQAAVGVGVGLPARLAGPIVERAVGDEARLASTSSQSLSGRPPVRRTSSRSSSPCGTGGRRGCWTRTCPSGGV